MAQETTFGCGQFLPGYGPGNFPDFEGGGTVDSGSGGGDPPIEEDCTCVIDGTPPPPRYTDIVNPTEGQQGGGCQSFEQVIPMTCVDLNDPKNEGAGARDEQILLSLVQSFRADGWDNIKISGSLGNNCINPCPGPCPNIIITGNRCFDPVPPGGGDFVDPLDPVPINDFPSGVKGGSVTGFTLGEAKIGKPRASLSAIVNAVRAGAALFSSSSPSRKSEIEEARKAGVVDLNDNKIKNYFRRTRPSGFIDSDIAIFTKTGSGLVPNTTGHNELFSDFIDNNINYILKNNGNVGNWESNRVAGVGVRAVKRSLKPEVYSILKRIKNYDGTFLTDYQIFSIIGSRILDGTINKLQLQDLKKLAEYSDKRKSTNIIKGSSDIVNEYAALSLIEGNYFSLDPSKSEGVMKNILPNWKVLSTDIAKHLKIRVGGVLYNYYINDDDTFIAGSTLKVQDGDFVKFTRNGIAYKFFCDSEKDHAYIMSEVVRQKAIRLLGGDARRKLSVTAPAASGIEFDYSTTSPRQNYYVLSATLSSISTESTSIGSDLLKKTVVTYDLVDTSSVSGRSELSNYIRYKANNRTFLVAHDDLLLDYVERTKKLKLEQQDILPDTPKTNKRMPLLTRQIVWYIILYPTNKSENLLFNSKSQIISYDPSGDVTREEYFSPSLVHNLNKKRSNRFVAQNLAYPSYTNVLGEWDTQSRISVIHDNNLLFKEGYLVRGVTGSAEDLSPPRPKTGLRLMYEIIKELNTNYVISTESIGKSITDFDVFSRFKLIEFNKMFTLENKKLIIGLVRDGLVDGIRMFPPIRRSSGQLSVKKTQLVQLRKTSGATLYPIRKTMATGFDIESPKSTEKGSSSSFAPVSPRPSS